MRPISPSPVRDTDHPAVSVMLVEGSPSDAQQLRETLRDIRTIDIIVSHQSRLASALSALQLGGTDLILLELNLPDSQGLDSIRRTMAVASETPIVVLTGVDDERLAVESVKAGAQDYLVKGQIGPSQLQRSLRYALERHRTQTLLRNLSFIDELTGLHNRRGFFAAAENHLKLLARTARPAALAVVDVDRLKKINDELGHLMGDHALIEAGRSLRQSIRATDIAARVGGDEFYVLFLDAPASAIPGLQDRLTRCTCRGNDEPPRPYDLALTAGIIPVAPGDPRTLYQLIDAADAAMYAVRSSRKSA